MVVKIALAADHAGFSVKEHVKKWLVDNGYSVSDFGTHSDESTDYPDFAKKVAGEVSAGNAHRGVLVCGSGMGMCMSANRFPGVRAAVIRSIEDAKLSRLHNDANVACFGARITKADDIVDYLGVFLNTEFESGGRHEKRIKKIEIS